MKITIYISASIAIYKSIFVIRALQKRGHDVQIVMTPNSEKLVDSRTLAALTKHEVLDNLWLRKNEAIIPHIDIAQKTELAIVMPATANFIAKMANGIADDAASTTILATSALKLVVPAMNDQMWYNPATQRNIRTLKADGVKFLEPVSGMLAEGYEAKGRLPEPEHILAWFDSIINTKKTLKGKKIVITAGGTREAIDPVRFIGNKSSGKMGIALTQAAILAGAKVILIYGNVTADLPHDPHLKLVHTDSSEQMYHAVKKYFADADALIMAAAVADWRPISMADKKIKKQVDQDKLNLTFIKTIDILKTVASNKKSNQIIIGFAAETNDLLVNAQKKLQEKNADIIIANDVSQNVFGSDQDQVTILEKNKDNVVLPVMSKDEVAQKIISYLK